MAVLTVTGGSVALVEVREQFNAPSAEPITAGRAIYRDPATGWAKHAGSAQAPTGIAINSTTWVGDTVVGMQDGWMELGDDAIQGLDYEASVYLHGDLGGTATGSLGDAPTAGGTFTVGTVMPVFGTHPGTTGGTVTARKLLRVKL